MAFRGRLRCPDGVVVKLREDGTVVVIANRLMRKVRFRGRRRRRRALPVALAFSVLASLAATVAPLPANAQTERLPWEELPGGISTSAVGAGLELSPNDLAFILQQVRISEQHAATATATDPCSTLIGPGVNQIPAGPNAEELPFGLRTVNGICNNLVPGQESFGATGHAFPRLTTPVYRTAETVTSPVDFNGPAAPNLGDVSTYNGVTWVEDSEPRTISNLIVDQSPNNPAATAAAGDVNDLLAGGEYNIENTAPDEGLSAPFNSMFTFFGQFFDHGLDLTTKSGEVVYMPLQPDDPLFDPASSANFMLMSRATNQNGDPVNQTSPFVDQNQTYTSHPSHQVFMRRYELNGAGDPVSQGELLKGTVGGMATWADVKAQAATLLGIQLVDEDILNIPLLATDLYGKFIPGANGYPQIVLDNGELLEGDPTANGGLGELIPANGVLTGHAFLADVAHHAAPGPTSPLGCPPGGVLKTADVDVLLIDDGDCTTYDNEMLDAHFMAGDGRVNENIALMSVHHVFHSEHNRVVQHIKDVLTAQDPAAVPDWELAPGVWNGEYLFQAAKFATEMQYQHLVFEEFGRKIQPAINVFAGYDTTVDAAISVEFSQGTYRFGHSMLDNTVARFDQAGNSQDLLLFDAFLNPPAFLADHPGDPDDAAGAVFRGGTAQVGQQIDEFVVEALRNQLVGLPLDLPAINIARGRDYGIAPLNEVRRQLFAQTGDSSLAPYNNWVDFGLELRTSESLVNFVAAYGTHPSIIGTVDQRRDAAQLLVDNDPAVPGGDAAEFMQSTGAWSTTAGAATTTGLDEVDLWVGGLAESPEIFGGMLGSTHNYIFELQMEKLQDGDRFYYLHRLEGLDFLASLEGNSLGEMIDRNTTASNLPADVFSRPTYFFDAGFQGIGGAIVDDPNTAYDEVSLLVRQSDGTVRYAGVEHVNFVGGDTIGDLIHSGEGDDTVRGNGGDDRLEGDGGNDAIIGGAGNDILTDSFGVDVLKGGPGNDALQGGPLGDLLQGNAGDDFIVQGPDLSETFGGSGDDLIFGGAAAAIILGGDGNDWLEGGGQADLLQGGNANPFETDTGGGHDVLIGNGGADALNAEGGDDIIVAGSGVNRYEGMLGFDWVTHYNNSQVVASDLERTELLPPTIDPLASRFDLVEGLSGWTGDDDLKGDSRVADIADIGGNTLEAPGIALIDGLAGLLPVGTTSFEGNILLGGAGSDTLQGRGDDDILDGNSWLRVQIEAPDPVNTGLQRVDSMGTIQSQIFDGSMNPGDINIIREIIAEPTDPGVDVAVYEGPQADYDLVNNGDGTWTVNHLRGCGDPAGLEVCPDLPDGNAGIAEGSDLLLNIETVRFADADVDISTPVAAFGQLRVTTNPARPSQILVDGIARNSWGLTWVPMPAGPHEVCWTDVPVWVTPGCENIVVNDGAVTAVEGVFQQNGWLRVQTSPALPSTISVDGVPSDDFGIWVDITPGDHEVCWGAVANFTPPPCETVTVTAGATNTVVGTFTPSTDAGPTGHGRLRVTTSPAVPAKIIVDGTVNDRWALSWVKLDPGSHEICYSDVPGFSAPPCETVTVTAGTTTTAVGNFVQRGTIRVQTSPPVPSTLTVDGITRNAWGMWTTFEPGSYEVCFGDVSPLTTPACQTAVVTAGNQTTITGVFS